MTQPTNEQSVPAAAAGRARATEVRAPELLTYQDLITHDVADVATALLGLVEQLLLREDAPLTGRQEELLLRARRQAFDLCRLAQSAQLIGLLSRPSGHTSGPVELSDAVRHATDMVRSVYFDRPVEVQVECPADLAVPRALHPDAVMLGVLDAVVRGRPRAVRSPVRLRAWSDHERIEVRVASATSEAAPVPRLLDGPVGGRYLTGAALGLLLMRELVVHGGGALVTRLVPGAGADELEVALTLPRGG
ncbi:MAG TPA: hypothetical protein VG389_09885 [Myxococcota bacterium]|nr:hypothetical protein [Myxococcota bacterium]